MFSFSETSYKRMQGINPKMISIAEKAIEISYIDFGIPGDGGLRTAERQNELFNQGKSKADGFIRKSRHQSGEALDVYAYVGGRASWEPSHLIIVAGAMFEAARQLGLKIEWGGVWTNFKDFPHYQLVF